MVPRNTNDYGEEISRERPASEAGNETRPISVWLVDDSENFRVLLAALLEDEGGLKCERQFSTAEHVLDALAVEPGPDVILLDNRMPGMGGAAAVRPIRKLAGDTRVLMLTTFGDSNLKARALSDGASDFLLKSYAIHEIADRVRDANARPVMSADLVTQENAIEDWASRRAPGESQHQAECAQRNAHPEPARRIVAGGGECHSSRLVRGVRFLRSLIGQAIGRGGTRKEIEELVPTGNVH
jgi:DNA-binding NarL/FixJ family response regulator